MLDKILSGLPPAFDPKTLKPHPISTEYPPMDAYEFEGLKASIKAQGFRDEEPIWLYGDPLQILDGNNRHRAVLELGLVLSAKCYRVFVGTYEEAVAFSNLKNGHRRHLTKEQKEARVRAAIVK